MFILGDGGLSSSVERKKQVVRVCLAFDVTDYKGWVYDAVDKVGQAAKTDPDKITPYALKLAFDNAARSAADQVLLANNTGTTYPQPLG